MPPERQSTSAISFIIQVELAYASLMQSATTPDETGSAEPGLGGRLLYAAELDDPGRVLVAAANIAGAATLAASANQPTLRQALRDGIIDFLVNSLDEALRILKNEIRKRQPVAVGVSVAPQAMEKEVLERGVLPDLLPPLHPSSPPRPEFKAFLAQGAQRLSEPPSRTGRKLCIWAIPPEFAQHPVDFDALLLEHIAPNDPPGRRWVRLAPRYLGPKAHRLRSLACDEEAAAKLIARIGLPLEF